MQIKILKIGKITMTKIIKSDLKTLLINNLNDINNASSPLTINNLVLAMHNEKNDVFELQDWEKVREYCWNLASYKGQQKDKLGFITAERNVLFEANVLRAISVYKEQKIKGSNSKIQFKEKYRRIRFFLDILFPAVGVGTCENAS